MTVYQYNVYDRETFNAGGKAKSDVSEILNKMNIKNLYKPSVHRSIRILQQIVATIRLNQKDKNILIIQYPAVDDAFIKRVSRKSTLIAIVHDLRSIISDKPLSKEIEVLNLFDVVISHNSEMTKYLRNNGCISRIVEIHIFDYLSPNQNTLPVHYDRKLIVFAGNLNKSEFVNKLYKIPDVKFNMYGVLDNKSNLKGISYSGVLPSDKIVNELDGDYGLIWDGKDLDSCSGKVGNYLRYNNPHKMSLYLASGKPVIVWSKAAVAPFVRENNLGIIVNSLLQLPEVIANVTEDEYNDMLFNVQKVRKDLITGKYTQKAIEKSLHLIRETK